MKVVGRFGKFPVWVLLPYNIGTISKWMITKPFVNLPKPGENPDPDDLRAQLLKLSQEKFDRRKELIVSPRVASLLREETAIKF